MPTIHFTLINVKHAIIIIWVNYGLLWSVFSLYNIINNISTNDSQHCLHRCILIHNYDVSLKWKKMKAKRYPISLLRELIWEIWKKWSMISLPRSCINHSWTPLWLTIQKMHIIWNLDGLMKRNMLVGTFVLLYPCYKVFFRDNLGLINIAK